MFNQFFFTFFKRLFDLLLSFFLMIIFLPFIFFISILIKLESSGPVFHWSKRIGKNNQHFMMPKLRTMMINTPNVATHLLDNPDQYITKVGIFLRKTSLDEVPQLWSIFLGQMSFVGPRPALYNQDDLIDLRNQLGIDKIVPGLTGWAQINGRDLISNKRKADLDFYYFNHRNIWFDLKIISITIFKVMLRRGIKH